MASRRLPFILAMEIESAGWQANSSVGDTQAYPRDEHCQSSVGSASDPWRVAQDRHRNRADQCGQVHGQATRPAVSRLEDIPSQSRGWDRCDGYVRRADNLVSPALWIADHGARPATYSVVRRHSASNRRWIANQIAQACGWEQAPRYLRSPSLWARLPTPVAAKAGPVPTHECLGPDDCENLQD